METQNQTQIAEREGLTRILIGENFDISCIKPNNAIVLARGKKEIVSMIIPYGSNHLICTLSKQNQDILEKTYDYISGKISSDAASVNKITQDHPRYDTAYRLLNEKLGE